MALLTRAGTDVDSLFAYHGDDENDLSGAFAYLLSQSPALLRAVLGDLLGRDDFDLTRVEIRFQTARRGSGITDIEIAVPGRALVIIEAKKGSHLPTKRQMNQYARVCTKARVPLCKLVALSNIDPEPAKLLLGFDQLLGIPVTVRSWQWVRSLTAKAKTRERPFRLKFLLREYERFLEDFLGLDRIYSNLVYVVALASGSPKGWEVSWIDIVDKHRRYFYPPASRSWPPPPNYMGFRYWGRLQGIHRVESYEIVDDLRAHFPTTDDAEDWGPEYLLRLGPRIRPPHEVRTGPRVHRSARVWCMLDTLLTESTISDALSATERRKAGT